MALSKKYDEALTTIKDVWGGQLKYGGTTFFEVFRPSWNSILETNDAPPNNQCGYTSLAHPWSAGVTKWLSENVLGIKPVEPGFKSFTIIPYLNEQLTHVKGVMPTPFGPVNAEFNVENGDCIFNVPAGTICIKVALPKAGKKITKVIANGQLLWNGSFHTGNGIEKIEEDSNYLYLINVKAGNYKLQITYSGVNKSSIKPSEKFNYLISSSSIKQDSLTSGNWKNKYGKEGYWLFNNIKDDLSKQLPSYVSFNNS